MWGLGIFSKGLIELLIHNVFLLAGEEFGLALLGFNRSLEEWSDMLLFEVLTFRRVEAFRFLVKSGLVCAFSLPWSTHTSSYIQDWSHVGAIKHRVLWTDPCCIG